MATIFKFLIFASIGLSQVTFSVGITGEPSVSITVSAEGLSAGTNMLLSTVGPGTSPNTLTANATNVQTTFAVANILGVTTCMGIVTGSEVSLITGITPGSGTTGTLTVTRHTLGTSAASYTSGQAVNYIAWGSGTCYLAYRYQSGVQAAMISTPGPLVQAQNTNHANATAATNTLVTAAVTHTP